jgi:hypothetical protein
MRCGFSYRLGRPDKRKHSLTFSSSISIQVIALSWVTTNLGQELSLDDALIEVELEQPGRCSAFIRERFD